jgi:hypothetical protein
VSNPDSFINEVTEEVRRDRLYKLYRKYGWIGVVLVLVTVGGTAWREWSKSQAEARAESFGDAVLAALAAENPEARLTALAAVPATGEQTAVLNLLMASDPAENRAATLAALDKVAADAAVPATYRDLAVLRRVLVAGTGMPVAERRAALEPLAVAGRPFRPLAVEQLAYLLIEEGRREDAVAALRTLVQDQQAPQGLRARAGQMIVALGGVVEEGQAG